MALLYQRFPHHRRVNRRLQGGVGWGGVGWDQVMPGGAGWGGPCGVGWGGVSRVNGARWRWADQGGDHKVPGYKWVEKSHSLRAKEEQPEGINRT